MSSSTIVKLLWNLLRFHERQTGSIKCAALPGFIWNSGSETQRVSTCHNLGYLKTWPPLGHGDGAVGRRHSASELLASRCRSVLVVSKLRLAI
ncbi:hypothetical protein GWI33_007456 [Rhynchophorus ferrugineus]|uniref:Uncharacterized protein n=1 Tax=Rhynchophorus ferrugineus TaxID=354439 RepID=A0A834IG67_RHYFE|nr:hypothetical protein GWI33_007456 [Rhynchophorus ferrugineus]